MLRQYSSITHSTGATSCLHWSFNSTVVKPVLLRFSFKFLLPHQAHQPVCLWKVASHFCHWLVTLTSCLIPEVLFTFFLFLIPFLLPLIASPLWFVYGAAPHWQGTMCQEANTPIEANHQIHNWVKIVIWLKAIMVHTGNGAHGVLRSSCVTVSSI